MRGPAAWPPTRRPCRRVTSAIALGLRRPGQPVAKAIFRRDVGLTRCNGIELRAEIADGHSEQVDVDVVPGAPHGAEHLAMGHELSRVLDEVGDEAELHRGELFSPPSCD